MKKFVLAIIAIVASFGTINATETPTLKTTTTSIEYTNVSTFCRLIKAGNYEAVKAMIENGTNINRKSTGLTPLMFAARYNKVEIVKLLIKKGAKLKTKSDKGYTALQYAKMSKAHDAYMLIQKALDKK